MKLNILKLLLIATVLISPAYTSLNCRKGETKEEVLTQVMVQGIESAHYTPKAINDDFSDKVFTLYLERLDVNKKFLTQEDINNLKKYQHKIDDDIKEGTFNFFNLSYEIINKRMQERSGIYKELLASPFDFNTAETIETDAEKLTYAANDTELKEVWRKYIKYQVLSRLSDMLEVQEKAAEKKDTIIPIKPFAELEADARKKVLKTMDDLFNRLKKADRNDWLSAYLNSIANVFDPHTGYFPPKDKENFDINLSGRLEGIGASLQERDGNIRVAEIVPGSPSYRQGQLKAGDLILKVAQGNQEPVDIVGMRLDHAVQLIRGKKGTEVRLTVKKPDGSILVISIIRDVVQLEETYAQSAIIKGDKKVGYIRLPAFYADMNKFGGRSSAQDVKLEIAKLKKENVAGIILDLRDNGGGSLQDVIDMTGFFIPKGPVVQVKAKDAPPFILEDKDGAVHYDGPLVVLVNASSASASEILAAAVQDYKRGVIVSTSTSTFGKGTVQRFLNLDDYLLPGYAEMKPLGSVKLTIQKFYRINGDATQLKGVIPDIVLPDIYTYLELGEKEQDFPMPWDEISPVKYEQWNRPINISALKSNSEGRTKSNPTFQLIKEEAEKLKKQEEESIFTLNLEQFQSEIKKRKEEAKKYEAIEKNTPDMNIVLLDADSINIQGDSTKIARKKAFIKSLKKDIHLFETNAIMNDVTK